MIYYTYNNENGIDKKYPPRRVLADQEIIDTMTHAIPVEET